MKEKLIKYKDHIWTSIKTINKKTINIILSIFIAIVIFFITYKVGDYMTSPSAIAKSYFEKIINNDINGILKTFDEEESTFVSKELLKQKIDILENVDDYKIVDKNVSAREAIITIKYYLENDSNEYYAYVKLYKNRKNKYLIYDNWKVDSAKIVEDIKIKVPLNATVKIDDKDITSYKKSELGDQYYDIYQIDNMIQGEYKIDITLKNGTIISEKIEVEDNTTYSLGSFNMSDEIETNLENMILPNLQSLYMSAVNNTKYDELKSNLTSINIDNIEDMYINLKRKIQNNIITYNEIKISNIKINSISYKNGLLELTITMTHHDSGTYNAKEPFVQTDLKTEIKVLISELDNGQFEINNILI